MYNSWGKPLVNLPEETTMIWSCVRADCNGWIRASFSFEEEPVCAQCDSPMISSKKLLPILMSSNEEVKRHKKNQQSNRPD